MARSFVDSLHLTLQAGKGGAGAVSFLRERGRPKGGPDGGDGGDGGNVLIAVSHNLNTLSHLSGVKQIRAENGKRGQGGCRTGHSGSDARVKVPPGTLIYDAETHELVLDTVGLKSEAPILCGGRGGRGNHHFRGPRRQLPRFAQEGEEGESGDFRIELRLIADIGLIGLPNAGKSSLQNLLTNAHPKIGAYPFTTTVPNLGVLRIYEEELIIADIPGIIEGAAAGSGLGLQFLSHISRTAALLFVIDIAAENAIDVVPQLRRELADYDQQFQSDLLQKPWAILANKIDLPTAAENLEALRTAYPDITIVAASCLAPEYIAPLQKFLLSLKKLKPAAAPRPE
ncbi:MAG: GTPase ObgE [Spirochaetota bacterium]